MVTEPDSRWWRSITAATIAVVLLCGVRAVVRGLVPLEDNAVTEIRARDVFSDGAPLVGLVSSASQTGGIVAHPGPLQLDLLAIPVRLLPGGAGLFLGSALISAAAVGATGWAARRLLGGFGATLVAGVVAVLVWSLGSEALFEPWQPIAAMLPFMCGLVAAWAVSAGHDAAAPLAVAALSFSVQTHGSYLVLVPAVALVTAALRLVRWRQGRGIGRCSLGATAGVAALVWAQPLVDQWFGHGNMTSLWHHAVRRGDDAGRSAGALGLSDAVRAVVSVIVQPPAWTRGGMRTSAPLAGGFDDDWLALPWAVAGLVVMLSVLGGLVVVARRRSDWTLIAGGALSVVLVVAAIVSAAGLPVDAFGFSPHRVRWLWVIGAFLTSYVLVTALRSGVASSRRDATAAVAIVAAVALVATLPTSNQLLSSQQVMAASVDAVDELVDVAPMFDGLGVVYVNTLGRPLPDPYHDALAAAMVRAGVEVRVAGDYSAAQYGRHRRLGDGPGAADVTVHVFVGPYPDGLPAPYGEVARIADGLRTVVVGVAFGTVRERPG